MIGPVVVGVDGSTASRDALGWAAAEAATLGAPLEVVHAWRKPMMFIPRAYPSALVEAGRMDDAARSLVAAELATAGIGDDVTVTPVEGGAAKALLGRGEHASLLVVGRTGTGRHPLLGNTAEHLARHAPCPVAVVPSIPEPRRGRVVVGVDSSAGARRALTWAASAAARRGATLEAVLAWSFLDQIPPPGGEAFDPRYDSDHASAALDAALAGALGQDAGAVVRTVVCDLARNALVEASGRADLVVVGRRGVGGFDGLLLGSVSRLVLERATCPTVVVHAS